MNPLLKLHSLGQRVWLDNLSRTLLREGKLKRLIDEDGLCFSVENGALVIRLSVESSGPTGPIVRTYEDAIRLRN